MSAVPLDAPEVARRRRRRCRCGGELEEGTATLPVALFRCGVAASVTAQARRCPRCGEASFDADVAALGRLAVGCQLAAHGVQTGDALRHMRKALGLRACDLGRLLDVTPETISHWETGRVPTPRAAFAEVAAMVEDAYAGRTVTRDRLARLAEARAYPRAISVTLPRRDR
jgi:ribosomal protein S27AE